MVDGFAAKFGRKLSKGCKHFAFIHVFSSSVMRQLLKTLNLIWIGIYKLCAFKSSYIRNTEKTKNTRYVNSKPHPRKASEPVHPKNQATLLNLLTYAQQTLCQPILISPVGPMSYLKA